jgi:hypothetical protein
VTWRPTDGGVTAALFDAVQMYDAVLARAQGAGASRCGAGNTLAGVPPCELPAGHPGSHAFLIEWRTTPDEATIDAPKSGD